jgi:hypothetical protein
MRTKTKGWPGDRAGHRKAYLKGRRNLLAQTRANLKSELENKGYRKNENPLMALGSDVLEKRKKLMERLSKV